MKNKMIQYYNTCLLKHYSDDLVYHVIEDSLHNVQVLYDENKQEPKAVKAHTFKKIYPTIATYQAMLNLRIPKDQCIAFFDHYLSKQAIPQARMIQIALKIPFLYKCMPAIFKWMTVNNFGEAAGFHAKFYDTPKTTCKFDMTKCLFYETCKRYECIELVPCFCHVDDVTNGHMHPYIHWHRLGTIGEGYEVCDFQIDVKKD